MTDHGAPCHTNSQIACIQECVWSISDKCQSNCSVAYWISQLVNWSYINLKLKHCRKTSHRKRKLIKRCFWKIIRLVLPRDCPKVRFCTRFIGQQQWKPLKYTENIKNLTKELENIKNEISLKNADLENHQLLMEENHQVIWVYIKHQ